MVYSDEQTLFVIGIGGEGSKRVGEFEELGPARDVALEEDDGADFVRLDEGYDVGAGGVAVEADDEELIWSIS